MSGEKHRILVVYDVHLDTPHGRLTWAYGRRANAVLRYAPPDFDVEICQYADIPWGRVSQFDLIFNIEYAAPSSDKFRANRFKGPLVCSYNSDARRRLPYWDHVYRQVDWLIVNNLEMFEFKHRPPHTCCISNGVDAELFRPLVPIASRPQRCIFSGSTGITKMKGWSEVFRPLEQMLPPLGFETDFRPVDEIKPEFVMPTEKTIEWYNSASYCLIASASEGTPNLLTEAVACGCVAVTVPVGNVCEWGRDRENCVLTERNAESFVEGLLYAREHRERLSAAGIQTIRDGWSYGTPGHRADYFFQLFRRLITDGPDAITPFAYNEKHWSEI